MKTAIREQLEREESVERELQEDKDRWQRYVETGAVITNAAMMHDRHALAPLGFESRVNWRSAAGILGHFRALAEHGQRGLSKA